MGALAGGPPGQSKPPGWYADPAGGEGRVRWWDGSAWTELVRDPRPPRSGWPWGGGGGVLFLLFLVLIGAIAAPRLLGPAPTPRPSVVTVSPRPGTPGPTISAEPPDRGPVRGCASGSTTHRQRHPEIPGSIAGGGIRYALPPGWKPAPAHPLKFGSDLASAAPAGSPAWVTIGAVRATTDDFATPLLAARSIITCLDEAGDIDGLGLIDRTDEPITIPGAREGGGLLAHFGPSEGKPTRTVLVVVADTGAPESMPFLVAVGGAEGQASDADLHKQVAQISVGD